MIQKKIAPSMMCCDFFNLKEQIRTFEQNDIEILHIDIMDGRFVPNIQLGIDFVKQIKKNTNIPLDYHLMVENPEIVLNYFDSIGEGDYVSIHYESTYHVQRVLTQIKSKGAKALIALNPATPICVIENILEDIDGVLIMTVNPGYSGQKLIPQCIKKIADLKEFLIKNGKENVEIEVDGNVSFENAKIMSEVGANIFVAGSSSVFTKALSLQKGIEKLRKIINVCRITTKV